MTPTIFFRLLSEDDKGGALIEAVAAVRDGRTIERVVHAVGSASFRQVPGSPFAYWVSEHVRGLFTRFPRFEGPGRMVRQGGVTGDDARHIRAWWEVDRCQGLPNRTWVPFAKGGRAIPFYADIDLVAGWDFERGTFSGFTGLLHRPSLAPANSTLFFRPGLTWPLRAANFCPAVLPEECIFSIRGYAILAAKSDLLALLAIASSSVFDFIFKIALGRYGHPEFIVGVLQKLPLPHFSDRIADLSRLAFRSFSLVRSIRTAFETSRVFELPGMLKAQGATLTERAANWKGYVAQTGASLIAFQREIDDIAFALYGIAEEDRRGILEAASNLRLAFSEEKSEADGAGEQEDTEDNEDSIDLVAELLSYAIGCALGRWDVRVAIGESGPPGSSDPFAPLPVCSPGMLVGPDGLPLGQAPSGYPLLLDLDGIMVDDAGVDGNNPHSDDIPRRVREVLEVLWGDRAEGMEREACESLGVKSLRDYFRRPAGFFAHHLQRYSKSKRQAPIYWPLSTASGSYTVWLYYPRLTQDLLYKAVNDYVNPKLAETGRRISDLRERLATAGGREATRLREALEEATELQGELEDFKGELLRVAGLPYKPSLDDGVVICAAPLWRLFRLAKWRSELERRWKKLEAGEYDWAHLAYAIWPDRVREKCRRDRSLAIAHGLEHLYEGAATPVPRRKRTRGIDG